MNDVTVFANQGRNGGCPSKFARRLSPVSVFLTALLLVFAFASVCAAQSGGKPPTDGDTVILPEILPLSAKCQVDRSAFLLRLNTPTDPADTVVAAALQCGDGYSRPYYWQHGAWTAIPLLAGTTGGRVTYVSDRSASGGGPLIAGSQYADGISVPFVAALGAEPLALPLFPGYGSSWAPFVSPDGEHVVGDNWTEGGEAITVRWNWNGATWQAEVITDFIDNIFQPSDDASVVTGNYWIWMEGAGDPQLLAEGTNALDPQ